MEVLGASSGGSTGQVWISNHPTEGWAPGRVDSIGANGCYVVVDDFGQSFEIPQDQARAVDPVCLKGVDDLLSLGDFNEGALLNNIRVRYFKDDIYTGIGGPILISVNPFAALPALYSEAKQKFYREKGAARSQGLDVVVPPHLFSVADSSYMSMLGDNKNQSIIISGESGAGKTEATKRILIYFAGLQKGQESTKASDAGEKMGIEQQVLRSNPILEAFGNAKTIRNDNSSRFGKFIEIEFDHGGKLQSARITNYLLEKPRVVRQQPGERGYHSFYQLCAGAPALPLNSVLHLEDSRDHIYIQGLTEIPGVSDEEDFQEMVECMQTLGFSTEERSSVFKIVAAILHLGDLEFEEHANSAEGSKICDSTKAQWIAEMLHVQLKDFIKVFQFKTLEDPFTKKIIDMPQDAASSSNTRHSMAKVAYSRLFDWLVWRINQATMSQGKSRGECKKIGILDIYGFEVFEWNSFEQLCINFANEKLQQHFNSHMFTLEQKLYSEEGIIWSHIEWQDNRDIIDHLEKKPLGLFCIVDSECLMPNATDNTCLSKIYSSFKTSKTVYKPSRFASTNFGVAHYAGEVIYDITSFIEKNTDKLHADIMNLLKSSTMPLLKTLFSDPKFAPELQQAAAGGGAAAKRAPGARPAPGRGAGGGDRAKQNVTVSMMFRQQLDLLVEDLNKTHPRYIRCIKPNANKQAHDFDSLDVQRQLRCAGMLESIRIRRAGYSVRRGFKEFFNRFRVLCPTISPKGSVDPDYKELSRKLLNEMEQKFQREKRPLEAKSWQIGRSKVFLKEELQAAFEKEIGVALQGHVKVVQKVWRGYKMKKRYRAMKKAAMQVQAALQTMRAVAEFRVAKERNKAALVMQANLRMIALRLNFSRRRNGATMIQRVYRGHKCRQKIGKLKGKMAADKIQRMREEEARNEALKQAQLAAEQKAKEMEEMKKQLAAQQKNAEDEARRKFEEEQQARLNEERAKREQEQEQLRKQREQEQAAAQENLQQQLLELRKENAKLQGQLEIPPTPRVVNSGVSEAEMEHLKRELQETKREKVRLEVELATAKSSAEYDAIVNEANQLREECSQLRRSKMDTDLRLEQGTRQIESLQAQVARAEQLAGELSTMRASHDELQVQLQKIQAQKASLEDSMKHAEQTRGEVSDLRLEKMRLEGELETAKMREEAMSAKLKNSENSSVELQQQKQRAMSVECELDCTRKEMDRLREQVATMSKEGASSRNEALDALRMDLLNRIESKPVASSRPSIMPPLAAAAAHDEGDAGRKTLVGQRDLFEKLKQQFAEATGDVKEEEPQAAEVHAELGNPAREAELEEELRQVSRDNVELNIRITSLQEEVRDKSAEASQLLQSNSNLQAEFQDLKFQLDHETTAIKRLTSEKLDIQAKLQDSEGSVTSLRRRCTAAEESLVKAEEDLRASQQNSVRLQEEQEVFRQRAQQLQKQVNEAVGRENTTMHMQEESKQLAERYQKIAEDAERSRAEVEANTRWLQSENERLKAELNSASQESIKIRQVVDEVMERGKNNEELERQIESWKARANKFEKDYTQTKQLNNEMTKMMTQMTQSISERSGDSSEMAKNNKMLQKQLEVKTQEARHARLEKDDIQKRLDSLESTGSYFQDKYREASSELKQLRQETQIATASSSKLRSRVESLQQENEDLKVQCGKLQVELRSSSGDEDRVGRYEQHVRQLQETIKSKDLDLEQTNAEFAKAQQVNDCLNSLLVLESESTGLLQSRVPSDDTAIRSQLEQKKSKATHVIERLNAIMKAGEQSARPSIPYPDLSMHR